ncbi:MAG: prepilin peptidase [archaeon]|nr:prepilin peptidase [archaeon]
MGIGSSFTDIKEGRIPNMLVLPAVIAGFILAVLSQANLFLFASNAIIAFAFGFVLYLSRMWSAGDSKLFLAFAVLFPLASFPSNFVFFPAFSLILNSFIPAFVALFALAILRTSTSQKFDALKKALNPKTLVSLAVILFAFYWALYYVLSFLSVPLDFFLIVIILFLMVSLLEKAFPNKLVIVSAVGGGLLAAVNLTEVLKPDFWVLFVLIFALMVFLRFFILYLGFFAFGKRVEIAGIRPGMVLLEGVYEKNGALEKKKLFFPSLINALQDIKTNYVFDLSSKGLTEENVKVLLEKNKAGKANFHSLLVQETLPFAPLLFAGTIITFFCSIFLPWC